MSGPSATGHKREAAAAEEINDLVTALVAVFDWDGQQIKRLLGGMDVLVHIAPRNLPYCLEERVLNG